MVAPDFLVLDRYDKSEYVHNVPKLGNGRAKSNLSTHDSPPVQDCIGGGIIA
jgi:hypothetical protein